ncbi:MAG: hypothetical protein WDW38_006535 [Sanguina aurantia]
MPASVSYAIWQHEVGDSGTEHLQGYLEFNSVQRLSACKKLIPRAHWEQRKGTQQQAHDYCTPDTPLDCRSGKTKRETREFMEGPWEHGVYTPGAQGFRTDIQKAAEIVKAHGAKRVAELMPDMYIKYERGLKALEFAIAKPRDWAMDVRVHWGDAGTGKARDVYTEFGAANIYTKDPTTEWWDGYNGEQCVLLDEFYGTLKFSYLQRLMDRYPMMVQIKGGTTQFRSRTIIFTCNVQWQTWYPAKFESNPEILKNFERRLSVVKEYVTQERIVAESVAELNAFIFEGKYLFDDVLRADVLRRNDNDTQQLLHLDGLQRDRLHVNQILKAAYPSVTKVLEAMHGPEHGRIKILMIDFTYYVLQGHAFQTGHVVVPLNQQSNDVRALNLTVLPGTDRKDYRGTDVVPRDGISLGSTSYLPRSVTICKAGLAGKYNFKITSNDGKRKMMGFTSADASEVYRDKVIPELVTTDPMFHESNRRYQDLCKTYFIAFPAEGTTSSPAAPPTPTSTTVADMLVPPIFHPRSKEQLELKKRAREEAAAKASALPQGMRECKTCASVLPVLDYEGQRLECKGCRKDSRAAHDATIVHAPETARHPDACLDCGTKFDHGLFVPRGQGYRGSCRDCINGRGYSEAYRARQRQDDLPGYLERNAATHLAWAHEHPEAVREQQRKQETEPDRAFKAILTNACARGIDVEETSTDALKPKLSMACHYCDYSPPSGEHLNGLDRVDSDAGYTGANTVPCCSTCNNMKGCHDMHEFIHIMRGISSHRQLASPDSTPRTRLHGFGGWAKLREAPAKDKRDMLSADLRVKLKSLPCYLCGLGPAEGIDRVDSNGGYTEDNVSPCCADCNYAKKHLALSDFLMHVSYVCAHTATWVLKM